MIHQQATESQAIRMPAAEGYRRWSSVYDADANPMIALEQRFLGSLLPAVKGRDVVDLGCGTGRWLEEIASMSPRNLVGIDSCGEMLSRAEQKLRNRATLLLGNCEAPPLSPASADLILCSFVLSYISDLDKFAHEIQRIARPGADIFVTDLHPETELKFGWRRGFRDGDARIEVETHRRPVESILTSFERRELRPVAVLEIPFGEPEFEILRRAGKSGLVDTFRDHPAIYLFHLRCAEVQRNGRRCVAAGSVGVHGARVALGPAESANADMESAQGRIACICTRPSRLPAKRTSPCADLTGFLMLPGLINAHDHLEFALFPRLGKGGYQNFVEWANDIYRPDESPVRENRAVPKSTRLWWGAIRNLLCGVTTVCHHNPYVGEVFGDGFPVRVVRDFGWAHSLALDPDVHRKYEETPEDQPFIVHLGEGIDEWSANELFELDRIGALSDRTVVVHGLAFDQRAISLLKSRGAALVWCPTSNVYLLGRTHGADTIRQLSSVALGSDSSLTAQGDLLDEVRFARENIDVSAAELWRQVTLRPADALRLKSGEGSIRIDAVADLVAIRDSNLAPAEALAGARYREVEFVMVGGQVQLASPAVKDRLASELLDGLEPLRIDGELRWIRAPLARLFADARNALGHDFKMNERVVEYGAA